MSLLIVIDLKHTCPIIIFTQNIATPVSSQLNGFQQICSQNPRNMSKKNHSYELHPGCVSAHLYPVDVGFHLQLLHQLPGLCDAGRVIARHGHCQSVLACAAYVRREADSNIPNTAVHPYCATDEGEHYNIAGMQRGVTDILFSVTCLRTHTYQRPRHIIYGVSC